MTVLARRENVFPSLWNGFFDDGWFSMPNMFQTGTSVPAVNIKDTADNFIVEMAAPGMKKEDFHVDLDNNVLTISVEDKHEESDEDKDGRYTRREFNYRAFSRTFTLPDIVEADKISAKYKDGVLLITIPKKEEAKPKPVKHIAIS